MQKKQRGMSLIEILVVLTLFTAVVVIANQALFAALKGSKKSEVTSKVKQAANYVVSVMERELHSATVVTSCASNKVNYSDSSGQAKFFECKDIGTQIGGYVDSSSGRITPTDVFVSACSLTCSTDSGGSSVSLDMTFVQSTTATRPDEATKFPIKTRILLRN